MEPTKEIAEQTLRWAEAQNPGPWGDHSRYVAEACRLIAARIPGMDGERAYICGLLHDVGRYPGVTGIRHMLDGYRFCKERGWDEAAQICLTHGYILQDDPQAILGKDDMTEAEHREVEALLREIHYDDYDRLAQLCDALALPSGFCLLEKRWIDVALRYGTSSVNAPRWRRVLEIKADFEQRMGCCIYDLLPGVVENTFR